MSDKNSSLKKTDSSKESDSAEQNKVADVCTDPSRTGAIQKIQHSGYPYGGHRHYGQDSVLSQRGLRDGGENAISRRLPLHNVEDGLGQGRNCGARQQIQYSGYPSRGNKLFGQDCTLGDEDKTESGEDEISGESISYRVKGRLGQGRNTGAIQQIQYSGYPSRGHRPYGQDFSLGKEDKTESGEDKISGGSISYRVKGRMGQGRNTGAIQQIQYSALGQRGMRDSGVDAISRGPFSHKVERGLGQGRNSGARQQIQISGYPYRGRRHYGQDCALGQRGMRDSGVDAISRGPFSHKVEGGLGQGRNSGARQQIQHSGYPSRGHRHYGQNCSLGDEDKTESGVDEISREPKGRRVTGGEGRNTGTIEKIHNSFASGDQALLGQGMNRNTRKERQSRVGLLSKSNMTHTTDSVLEHEITRKIKENLLSTIDTLMDGTIKNVCCEDILDKCVNGILEEKDKALVSHQKKCDEVMQSIESLQSEKNSAGKTKFIVLDQFEKRQAEKEALIQKALELNCQKKEFTDAVSKLIDRIRSLMSEKAGWEESDLEIKEVKQLMEREKERLSKALPIYAKRSVITKTVKDNQVSIILGETGSGKSTQVVQYLYDSGLAEKGLIVCTQPRKVAAFSLEKYISEEMKGSGHVVECSVGARAPDKRAKKTKILFTTDYSLLMECIKDQDLTRFSCVIIDEAHERNMNTDLLLGIIKKALPRRPDLRVIITSATINPDLFIKYFGDCPVVKVSGKTFPVDVIWKKEQISSGDYVLEAVEKVVEIHENEEAGDVLVFLTCPAEIEQSCTKVQNRIKKDDILFLPLHGKLRQEEQNEVFKPTPKEKRKVVFSTNCAETSLTIPGIKFVVDTGKAKEVKYDPKRNMNSLEVSDISQSSADQRKGRAGRIESGKCYRLYTEDDFKSMEKSSKPEILRVNLGQAFLKLMELGIRNPADFDYVESPPVESIKTAMMELEELGATSDGQLTELGKKMAKVPVDPSLSKFLFEGFEQGVGYEALVLVSVATITGNVFFRMGTEIEKKAADTKKVEFCHLGGDFMTMLDVYRSWEKVDKRDRGGWCFDKSLNAKAMRMADETVKDLKSTLKHELKMPEIKWSSLDKETTDGRLHKTLFSCFLTKLCVYTGHERKGYKTTTGGHFVKIHPSSSINFTGSNPQFIVYEKILKTSQDFLLNVTPIEKSWLQESIAEKKLDLDIEEVLADVLMVTPPISIRCSSILIKRAFEPFRSKLPNLEKNISDSSNNAPVIVKANRNAGKVELFVPKNYAEKAVELTQNILEEQRGRLREETREYPVIAECSALRVVVGNGLAVQQILLPDMESSAEPKKTRQMSQQGRDSSEFNLRIKITWFRREPQGMATVSFENQPDEIWQTISSATGLTVGSQLAVVRKDKHKEKTIFVRKLNTNTTKQDIREALKNVIHGCDKIKDQEILIQYKQRATLADTETQKKVIEELISAHGTPGKFEVIVKELDLSNKSPFGVAHVDFLNPNEGIQAVRHLNGKACRSLERWEVHLEVKPFLNFFVISLRSVYDLVSDELKSKINEIAKECAETCKQQVRLKAKPAKSKERIELSVDATCWEHHLQASKAISKCIQGDKIECPKTSMFLLGKSGRDHLKEIQKQSGAFICTDERTMAISLYGTSEQREKARDAVYSFLQDLALQGSTVWEVNLKEDGMPRGLLKQLMSKYGREFEGLLEIEGVNNVDICLFKHVLKVQSTPDAKSSVLLEIEETAKTIAPVQPKTEAELEEEECPTCFCVIDDKTPSYRLAICGHACCKTCIEQQFNAAVFPLCCTHEDCPEMFTLDMIDLLTEKKLRDKVMRMSLKSYVGANQDKARYCPTPDCPMVYLVTTDGKLFRCNVCAAAICSSCHEPYHLGLTCEENEIEKKDTGRASFEKWMNEKPGRRKRCPTCTSPIEKNGGCNHMQCVNCKSHICWPCMKVFSSGTEVYAHQALCPIRLGY